MICPRCYSKVADGASKCSCGFSGAAPPPSALPRVSSEAGSAPSGAPADGGSGNSAAGGKILVGLLFLVGGIAVTVLTYQSAASSPRGGEYIIAHGPIVFGLLQLFRGIGESMRD
jgi:hypothetical protein